MYSRLENITNVLFMMVGGVNLNTGTGQLTGGGPVYHHAVKSCICHTI